MDFRPSALLHLLVVVAAAAAVEARPMVAAFVVKEADPTDVVAGCVVGLKTAAGVVVVAAVAAEGAAFADLAFRKDYVYPTQAAAAADIHAAYSAT